MIIGSNEWNSESEAKIREQFGAKCKLLVSRERKWEMLVVSCWSVLVVCKKKHETDMVVSVCRASGCRGMECARAHDGRLADSSGASEDGQRHGGGLKERWTGTLRVGCDCGVTSQLYAILRLAFPHSLGSRLTWTPESTRGLCTYYQDSGTRWITLSSSFFHPRVSLLPMPSTM